MKIYCNKLIISFLILCSLSSCNRIDYVDYKPYYLSENNEYKTYGAPELDSIEFKNTIQVLDYYGVDYKTKNKNRLLIGEELSLDWELVWNYTTKANNIEWLETHNKSTLHTQEDGQEQ